MTKQLLEEAAQLKETLISNRRYLHSHAGTGFDLKETLAFVKKELTDDALPIKEEAEVDFPSCWHWPLDSRKKGYIYPQHHLMVKFDEDALVNGSAVYAYTAMRWLEEHRH